MSEFDAAERPPLENADTLLTPMKRGGATPRTLMVRKLADIVVLPTGRVSSNERSLVADILLQVVEKVEPEIRAELARRISRVAECPPALIRMLLLDTPEVAKEVLENADALPEALMIEPTETESKQTLDRFAEAMLKIAEEARQSPELVRNAPHSTTVRRLDEVKAAREQILSERIASDQKQ